MVDFDSRVIHVTRSMSYLPGGGTAIYKLNPPKTAAGKRDIPMTKAVYEVLLDQRKRKDLIENRHVPKDGLDDLVFTSKTNKPIHETNVRAMLRKYVDKVNAENDICMEYISAHDFRHTFATQCIAKGMKPKVLQKILGHNSLQMTMDLYCHVEDDTLKSEMALFGEML